MYINIHIHTESIRILHMGFYPKNSSDVRNREGVEELKESSLVLWTNTWQPNDHFVTFIKQIYAENVTLVTNNARMWGKIKWMKFSKKAFRVFCIFSLFPHWKILKIGYFLLWTWGKLQFIAVCLGDFFSPSNDCREVWNIKSQHWTKKATFWLEYLLLDKIAVWRNKK